MARESNVGAGDLNHAVETDDGRFWIAGGNRADHPASVEDEYSFVIQDETDRSPRGMNGKRLIIGVEKQDGVIHAGYCSISTFPCKQLFLIKKETYLLRDRSLHLCSKDAYTNRCRISELT